MHFHPLIGAVGFQDSGFTFQNCLDKYSENLNQTMRHCSKEE